eukprot:5744415-Amphidinium_carterae.1
MEVKIEIVTKMLSRIIEGAVSTGGLVLWQNVQYALAYFIPVGRGMDLGRWQAPHLLSTHADSSEKSSANGLLRIDHRGTK